MPLRPSGSFRWPASAVAAPLPSDPYYKVARHAALASGQERVAATQRSIAAAPDAATQRVMESAVKVMEPLRQIGWLQSSANYLDEVPQQSVSPSHIGPAPSVSPVHESVDSLVASDQADSEAWLQVVAPAARVEFRLAKERIEEAADAVGAEQAGLLAQGLESLRRALTKLADQLFPSVSGKVENSFGDELRADSGAYINRLHLALDQAQLPKNRRKLEQRELEDFFRRFSALNARIADGVHRDGEFEECKTLYLDTWRVVRTCRTYLSS